MAVTGTGDARRSADGWPALDGATRRWLGPLVPQLPPQFGIYEGPAAQEAARRLGVAAFARPGQIYLGRVPERYRQAVLRHELVHLAQIQVALRGGRLSAPADVEREADAIAARAVARPVRCGADPAAVHPFVPALVALGVGLYVLLRPSPANAPGPGDTPLPPVPAGQIVGEAVCLFAVPGGAMALGARLCIGFLGRSALAGAATNVGLQAVGDAAQGRASPPLLYLFDATTGAAIGFVVPGGFRLIGRAGTQSLDRLATLGLSRSEITLTRVLSERALDAPLTAAEAQLVLAQRGMIGQVSKWWLDRRNLIVLYRGQQLAVTPILSPLARTEGLAASEALLARLRAAGVSDVEIASESARAYDRPYFDLDRPGLTGLPVGQIGIPSTTIPGIAGGFAGDGVIYVLRVPRSVVVLPRPWQLLEQEEERTIFNSLPPRSIVQVIPARRVAPLVVDGNGLLAPGR